MGGLKTMGNALQQGVVLVMSLWVRILAQDFASKQIIIHLF
jgi:hypothetical protein